MVAAALFLRDALVALQEGSSRAETSLLTDGGGHGVITCEAGGWLGRAAVGVLLVVRAFHLWWPGQGEEEENRVDVA